jgi:DNA-directed RNA polymerase sigma subunit (sigma70/sigma32)
MIERFGDMMKVTRDDGQVRTFHRSEKKAAYRWRRRADANMVHKCDDHRLTSYEAIGEYLRITPARVRQLEAQAIKKIKAAMTTDRFFEEFV